MKIVIEEVSENTVAEVVHMALTLWPHCDYKEEYEDFTRIINSSKETTFISKEGGVYTGFATLSLRTDYVEGASSKPVGYLEGIYVKPEFRKTGVGKLLVEKGEEWAKAMGCKDFCSDAEIINQSSIDFHKRVGFEEVNQIVCFRKRL